jgi:hypothetical protein
MINDHGSPRLQGSDYRREVSQRQAQLMSFINDHGLCHLLDAIEPTLKLAASQQVGVVEDNQVAEIAPKVAKIASEIALPNVIAGSFGNEQGDTFSVVDEKSFDEHHAHIGLSKPDTIAKKGSARRALVM